MNFSLATVNQKQRGHLAGNFGGSAILAHEHLTLEPMLRSSFIVTMC